ncbi:rRNA maturation RNase YbeY [Desulfovibrio aminophilus]|uniref:rRNA maturation RNase YbeY n=1 Tax=Desulfovibrio aminophilus TaxID=81425 RepID=UPI00339309B6
MAVIERRLASDPRLPLSRHELEALLANLTGALGIDGEFSLALVDDREMAVLNLRHLDCPGPTNVLAFESGGEDGLGEIVLSVPTCLREARLYGQEPARHLARLLAHALLHLAGFDHGPEMDALTEHAVDAARL